MLRRAPQKGAMCSMLNSNIFENTPLAEAPQGGSAQRDVGGGYTIDDMEEKLSEKKNNQMKFFSQFLKRTMYQNVPILGAWKMMKKIASKVLL